MPQLKCSVPDWCYFKKDVYDPADYYRRLRALGYTGAEMVPPERRAAAREAGLELVNAIGPGMRDGLNRRERHADLLPQIREAIRAAAADGIGQLILFSGNRQGQADEEGLKNCIAGLREVVDDAERAGVTLVFEMLCAQNHKDYQADRSAYGFDLVRTIGSPRVRVLYDIYHMFRMGEDVLDDILVNLDIIAHLHVAGSPNRDFPGPDQEIDYAVLVPRIRAAGYDGYWGMEWVPKGDSLAELEEGIRLFQSYL